ncbi:pyruvate formate lyase family protein [Pontiella sp. NLcol2]|uniref:Pyruvate formate lyase family protein n=2 Tax=Pontiella agarivorans TaxID=3038953 RepID=A0ABU5N1C2_9BACT|nr:pyruvate formate lyase family protein [Pontiella agarivorans]
MQTFDYRTEKRTYSADLHNSVFKPNNRIKKLIDRRDWLAKNHKKDIYCDNAEFLIYHWSGKAETFAAATGEQAADEDERINIGDHTARIDGGGPFPFADQMPSKVKGYEPTVTNWAEDYAFFLRHSEAEVHPYEQIVGEFHWQLDEARYYKYPQSHAELGLKARALGAGGFSLAHCCPDLSIGLKLGWGGLLEKVRTSRNKHESFGNEKSATYLSASEQIVLAVIDFVQRHAEKAAQLAEYETDPERKTSYEIVAQNCSNIVCDPPGTYHEALQWIMLYMVVERINGHGNGYGRFDQLLMPFYEKDKTAGRINRERARELLGEWYLKYGPHLSYGGRKEDGSDATSEMSWIGLEAYDMVGGYNQFGVQWHADMDPAFFNYACDVVGRHGCGVPALLNSDVMVASQLRTGFNEAHALNTSYSGCQWYCIPGREYQDQDVNCIVLISPMQRTIDRAIDQNIRDWDAFWTLYCEEVDQTAEALVAFKNEAYKYHASLWPEMITSLVSHGPIEKGRDVTDFDAVDYNYPSVNILGVPNVADSMYALKTAVFEQKRFTLKQVRDACASDWTGENEEIMRQVLLNLPKFGNDEDNVDAMAVQVSEQIRETMESKRCIKGGHFRVSLFQYQGHTVAGPYLGATPDGRKRSEPLAHGMNPMHKRNRKGMTATANSFCKLDFAKYQGGSFQVELHPSYFPEENNRGELVEQFARTFFKKGGVQINLNIFDLEDLKKAYEHPEDEKYDDIVVKVTGYSAHFTKMDRQFQKEFIERANYESLQ